MTLQSTMIGDVVVWFADDKPGLGWWHCAAIQPQGSSDGSPNANLIEAGGVVVVNCVAQLVQRPEDTAALPGQFAREMGQSPDDVILSEAGMTVREVRLELLNEGGEFEVLSRSESSGLYPFNAVLGATLMDEQAERFKATLAKEEGTGLRVVYDLLVTLPFAVSVHESRSAVTPGSTGESTSTSVITTFGDAPNKAAAAAQSTAQTLADESMARMTSTTASGSASASASYLESGAQSHPIAITADAAAWFALP